MITGPLNNPPKHRRAARDHHVRAACTDNRNAHDGMCVEVCPLHLPDLYAVMGARHRARTCATSQRLAEK